MCECERERERERGGDINIKKTKGELMCASLNENCKTKMGVLVF